MLQFYYDNLYILNHSVYGVKVKGYNTILSIDVQRYGSEEESIERQLE